MHLPASTELSGRTYFLLSLVLLVVLTLTALLTRPLIPIDETRYVSAAWEMWLRGDFLVPFKNGEPYSHKPPFLFWMFHLGWMVFGVNDWWPRLVMPLFSAASLLLTCLLAGRLWPQQRGLGGRAALILMSTLLWIVFSTSGMFDVLLAFWVLVGVHGILWAAEGRRRGFAVLGIAIGFGVLSKGPVILLDLLPLAVLAFWWQPGLAWRRWMAGLGLAIALGAAIALTWAIPAGQSGGEAYRNAIFWGQTADRMVDSFAHRRPFWWYLPLLPVLLFPWLIWPGFWQALLRHRQTGLDRGTRFCLAWMLPVLVAFSFVSGKQPHYLIPLFPAFALFASRVLAERPVARVGLPAVALVLLGAALVLAGSGQIPALRDQVAELPPLWPGVVLMVAGVLGWVGVRRGVQPVLALGLMGCASLVLLQLAAARSIEPLYEIKPMALAIKRVQDEGHVVANIAKYHAQYQFLGRLKAPLVELRGAQVNPWLAAHPDDYAIVYLKEARGLSAIAARHKQAYRGGAVVLVDTRTAADLLAGHVE